MPPHESTPLLSGAADARADPKFSLQSFIASSRHLFLGSWLNLLVLFVPPALLAEHLNWSDTARFTLSFVAIVPLAKLLGDATEQLSMTMGQTLGGLLNATFGNAVELIVAIVALQQNQLALVQQSLLGSVLSNLLLVLGMSFFASGFFYFESTFQVTAAQTSSSLLTLACITLIIPAAYNASEKDRLWFGGSSPGQVDPGLLELSRGTAIVLFIVYIAYLVFQLKTHHTLFEAEEAEEEVAEMDKVSAGFWLAAITVVTAFVADVLVASIEGTAIAWHIPKRFIAFILLPIVGNAAEHVTSIWMACKGKMELTIGVAVGSSLQIAAGMIPLLVLIAWPLQKELTLYFANFETIVMFVSVLLVNLLLQDGRTNWMEGLMLMALYVVIALSYAVQ